MKALKQQLEVVAQALADAIQAYEERRKYIHQQFSPKDYLIFCNEVKKMEEMRKAITEGVNNWFNTIIVELHMDLEEILKYEKT